MSLTDYIDTHRDEPFKWGVNDCLSFVSGALRSQGADELPAKWLGDYSSAWGAARHYTRLLQETGYDDIVDAMDDRYDRAVTLYPVNGAIVARPVDGDVLGYAFGVVFSGHVIFLTELGMAGDRIHPSDIFWEPTCDVF